MAGLRGMGGLTRLPAFRSGTLGRWSSGTRGLVLLGALALATALGAVPANGRDHRDPEPCRVVNTATAMEYVGLQRAIDRAASGHLLRIAGTCVGDVTIHRSLRLVGVDGRAVIRGKDGSAVTVSLPGGPDGDPVRLRGLVITGGIGGECPFRPDDRCGGGVTIHGQGTSVVIHESLITGNSATDGGGIYVGEDAGLRLSDSTVRGNRAVRAGGGIATLYGHVLVLRSTISGNTVVAEGEGSGGGIDSGGLLTVKNSTISGNAVSASLRAVGGGIASRFWLTVIASTVTRNRVVSPAGRARGGGIWAQAVETQRLESTILADNAATTGAPDCLGDVVSRGQLLVGVGQGCPKLRDGVSGDIVGTPTAPVDPRLRDLADNGGRTRTHALRADSPAIDAGGEGPCTTPRDQRGVSRPRGAACDIGAVERRVADQARIEPPPGAMGPPRG